MKSALRILTVVFLAAVSSSCRRNDYRTASVYLPGLKNQECAVIISNAVVELSNRANMGGTGCINPEKIEFDFDNHTMRLEYDSMKLALKNIEHVIADVGFDANEVPADSNAVNNLPPECR